LFLCASHKHFKKNTALPHKLSAEECLGRAAFAASLMVASTTAFSQQTDDHAKGATSHKSPVAPAREASIAVANRQQWGSSQMRAAR
jgi:hypothetical protein